MELSSRKVEWSSGVVEWSRAKVEWSSVSTKGFESCESSDVDFRGQICFNLVTIFIKGEAHM